MKKMKKLAALAVACIMALGSVTTVFAQESLTTTLYQKGNDYLLVGKGAQENSIVINLGGKSEVTTTYYAASPMMMEKPDYRVEVEDLPDDDEAEIKVIYNETLNMYGVQITAKDLSNSDFMIRYLKKTGSNYQAIAQTNIKLMIIDGDDYVSDEEISDERYSDLRSQAGSTNVLEGLESCADGAVHRGGYLGYQPHLQRMAENPAPVSKENVGVHRGRLFLDHQRIGCGRQQRISQPLYGCFYRGLQPKRAGAGDGYHRRMPGGDQRNADVPRYRYPYGAYGRSVLQKHQGQRLPL